MALLKIPGKLYPYTLPASGLVVYYRAPTVDIERTLQEYWDQLRGSYSKEEDGENKVSEDVAGEMILTLFSEIEDDNDTLPLTLDIVAANRLGDELFKAIIDIMRPISEELEKNSESLPSSASVVADSESVPSAMGGE